MIDAADPAGAAGGDYRALLGRLFASARFGMHLQLERVERCLERLGRPQDRLALVVQVGGTNGKGSTSAMVDAVLREAAVVSAVYSSPHLSRLTERFRIGGAEVEPAALVEADRAVSRAAAPLAIDLTFFERLTAMAVWLFAARGVEVAVLEVGLGGRLDATSAVGAGVAAVTGVALDHQEQLGDTLEAIAREKAGIFRRGQRAVVGASGEPEAVAALVAGAREAGVASLVVLDEAAVAAVRGPLGMLGEHQRRNAACALAVLDAIEAASGRRIDGPARARGLAGCRVAGRLELVQGRPPVVIDGAHNPQAARALAAALDHVVPDAGRWIAVLGASSDKDARGVVGPIARRSEHVIATASRHARAMAPADLAAQARTEGAGREVTTAPDLSHALVRARELAGPDGAVLIAGSLFLAGEARQLLCGDLADPLPVSDPR